MQLLLRCTAAVAVLSLCAAVASAQNVSVTVNGQPAALSPAPMQRAGRVFVPLRGVFEKLGASVVYANGQINAQGGDRSVSLKIGSTQASINGQPANLDVAPFIIGASTYVPLRFVAQALGAGVNWDNANRVVAITTGGGGGGGGNNAPPPQTVTAQPAGKSPISLNVAKPANGAVVSGVRPTIEATFQGGLADPNTIRVGLDGAEVTNAVTRSPNGIVYSPPSDLLSQQHNVRVVGKDTNGLPFDLRWSFTSGTQHVDNYIRNLTPANGANVGATFTVAGTTLPNAPVTIDAGANVVLGGIISFGGDHTRIETKADGNGAFSSQVSLRAGSGQNVTLVVTSTDPVTKTSVRAQRSFTIQ